MKKKSFQDARDLFHEVRNTKLAKLCEPPMPYFDTINGLFKEVYGENLQNLFSDSSSFFKKISKTK